MQNTKVTIKNIMVGAIAIVALFAIPHSVNAGSSSWDFSGDDYGYTSSPSYSYDSNPTYSYDSYPTYSYDSYTPSYTYSYDYPSYSSYKPVKYPTYSYKYAEPAKTTSKSTANAKATSYSYVYSNNTNQNTNTNTNTNVNNNNVNVIVYGGGGYSTSTYALNGQMNEPQLNGNCQISPSSAIRGQDVSFSAYATGGNGSYTYQWSGSEGLSAYSQSFTGRFYSTGNKIVYVHITSGNQSITRTCNVDVRDDNYNGGGSYTNLTAYCVAEPQNVYVGQTVTWRVYPSGGFTNYNNYNNGYNNGYNNYYNSGYTTYGYNWSGTDGLYGTSNVISRTYTTTGLKYAYVTVSANGQTYNTQCSINVLGGSVYGTTYTPPTTGTPVSGVFLSQLPATGIDDMLAFKNILIGSALVIWAIFMGYIISQKRKRKTLGLSRDRAEAFKQANLSKRV